MSARDGGDKGVSGIDGPVSRRLNRPISRRISSTSWARQMTPDQWSWIAFGTVCAGAGAFAARSPEWGGLLVQAGSVLDGVDGEVARAQGTSSAAGALLDLTLDRVSDVAVLSGMALGAGGRRIDWLLALAAANGVLGSGLVKERMSAEGYSAAVRQRSEGAKGGLDAIVPWTGRDGRLLAVGVAGVMRAPRLGLVWLAVSSNVRLWRRLSVALSTLRGR